jgi:hypothetical protein
MNLHPPTILPTNPRRRPEHLRTRPLLPPRRAPQNRLVAQQAPHQLDRKPPTGPDPPDDVDQLIPYGLADVDVRDVREVDEDGEVPFKVGDVRVGVVRAHGEDARAEGQAVGRGLGRGDLRGHWGGRGCRCGGGSGLREGLRGCLRGGARVGDEVREELLDYGLDVVLVDLGRRVEYDFLSSWNKPPTIAETRSNALSLILISWSLTLATIIS